MADSRSLVASRQPISVTDFYLKNNHDAKSNWDYREYLKNNATTVQTEMAQKSLNDVGYYQRFIHDVKDYPATATPTVPYIYMSIFDKTQPFGYQQSDMKDIYLSKEQLNARLHLPVIPKE
jgi:hypothetical protein